MATKNKKTKKQSHIGEICLSICVVAIVCFGVLAIVNQQQEHEQKQKHTDSSKQTETQKKDTTDKKEPEATEPDKIESDSSDEKATHDEKDDYETEQSTKEVERSASGKKVANVSLNVAQNEKIVILSGRVINFKEEGGRCSYILTNGSASRKMPSSVLPDAKYTVCEAISIDKTNLEGGTWTVKLEYQSNDAEGTSETQTFNI